MDTTTLFGLCCCRHKNLEIVELMVVKRLLSPLMVWIKINLARWVFRKLKFSEKLTFLSNEYSTFWKLNFLKKIFEIYINNMISCPTKKNVCAYPVAALWTSLLNRTENIPTAPPRSTLKHANFIPRAQFPPFNLYLSLKKPSGGILFTDARKRCGGGTR